jgi:hypothetical protein
VGAVGKLIAQIERGFDFSPSPMEEEAEIEI